MALPGSVMVGVRMIPPRAAAPTPEVTRRIGLSLGADLCWPIAYREILRRLDLRIPSPDGTLRFQVEDVTIEPFDLQKPVRYDLVIDRLTHWYFPTREWIKKCVVMDDLYVFNNPWSVQSMEKHSTYCAMMRLGLPVPRTWLIPPKSYDPKDDLAITLRRYARLFDLPEVGARSGISRLHEALRRRGLARGLADRGRRGAAGRLRRERQVRHAPAAGRGSARPLRPLRRAGTADARRSLRPPAPRSTTGTPSSGVFSARATPARSAT